MLHIPARIGGDAVTATRWMPVCNPYSSAEIARVPELDAGHVDAACRAAEAVLARRGPLATERADVLDAAAVLLAERVEEFAATIVAEAGRTVREARAEVGRCVQVLRFSASAARDATGESLPVTTGHGHRMAVTVRRPRGVLAAITPFNFPLNLVAHKVGPAIAAGCPVVLKPADSTPLSALRLVDLLAEAGLEADWISVLTGTGPEVGAPLVAHPVPAVVSFTGSLAVGRGIERAGAGKKVLLELGSNAPVIIEPDADLARAVAAVRTGGFSGAGQSCISTQRILVHESVFDQFVAGLAEAVATLVVGDPADPGTDVGPMIRPSERDRVSAWLQAAADSGSQVIGGKVDGPMLHPAIVLEPDRALDVYAGEVFGPVVTVNRYRDLDEGIDMANDSRFALHAGIFTGSLATAMAAMERLDFGGVIVNDVPTVRLDHAPYGGLRDSGNTREGPAAAVAELTDTKFLLLAA